MNTKLVTIAGLLISGTMAFGQSSKTKNSGRDDGEYFVSDSGLHHRIWTRITAVTNGTGAITVETNSFTELATGLNYQDNGGIWKESREEIEILPRGGAVARQGQHKVNFPEDIYDGEIKLTGADGVVLRSRVLGLSYYDAATGKNVLIAETTNSVGELYGSNVVIYADAFTDFHWQPSF